MIILGSKSESRYKLLSLYNAEIEVIEADIDELYDDYKTVYENVVNIAKDKGTYILSNNDIGDKILITADTVVLCNNNVLFKPKSYNDAFDMIKNYSNAIVEVVTGVYIKYIDEEYTFYDISYVNFSEISIDVIDSYLSENDYLKISGALDINTINKYFNYNIIGSYSNIIGLPMEKITKILVDIENEFIENLINKELNFHIDIFRSTVRTIIQRENKFYMLKVYTFDKKNTFYTSVGGGYHKFDNKIETLKKEAEEEAGIIIGDIRYLDYIKDEILSLNNFINYNKFTQHHYYLSRYKGETFTNYIGYENDIIIGTEIFYYDQLVDILEKQLILFKDVNTGVYELTKGDLEAVKLIKSKL